MMKTELVATVIKSANFQYLRSQCEAFRNSTSNICSTSITCRILLDDYRAGANNVVFPILFSDSIRWVVRVRVGSSEASDDMDTLQSEIATLRLLGSGTTIPVPQIFMYGLHVNNKFGFQYMVMDELSGEPLPSGLARATPERFRDKVASQLARIYFELSKLRFARIGRISPNTGEALGDVELAPLQTGAEDGFPQPSQTSLEYFYMHRKLQNKAALSLNPNNEDWKTACWILDHAVPEIVVQDLLYGPFPLCHLDFHYGNILFDKNYNITGVLDWTGAQTVPWERFFASPELMILPGLSEEQNRPIKEFVASIGKSLDEMQDSSTCEFPCRLSQLMGSTHTELAYRTTYTYPWRTLGAAQIVAKLLFGKDGWQTVKNFRQY